MGETPDTPLMRACQDVDTSLPSGPMIPRPVTTTRLSSMVREVSRGMSSVLPRCGSVLDPLFHVRDRVLDRLDLLRVVVGDLESELFLDRHHELDDVE